MLDYAMKLCLDRARDTLVGKVPDPWRQMTHITAALLMKWLADGRHHAHSAYYWHTVHSASTAAEIHARYAHALQELATDERIPEVIQDWFHGASPPTADAETTDLFLGAIDQFPCTHTEQLGDAFEHLLAWVGGQGKAGQFRTPPHIIDWLVEIVDPQMGESVLDPACGTGGFLTAALAHMKDGGTVRGDPVGDVRGYDIAPDMVRLARVNLYLHGEAEPRIAEYDTLTRTDRWDERADVILANPPFMSPKGGIRPHDHFRATSKRSEVLFVEYIARHLTETGRAAVIVPEGVLFTRQKGHIALRKSLVNGPLLAVISLPGGVFQPYSGVKTSVLLLNMGLSHHTDQIGFFQVEQDGFDLGARRHPVTANDLPAVRDEIAAWTQSIHGGPRVSLQHGQEVSRGQIAQSDGYNLSSTRYQETRWRPQDAQPEKASAVADHLELIELLAQATRSNLALIDILRDKIRVLEP